MTMIDVVPAIRLHTASSMTPTPSIFGFTSCTYLMKCGCDCHCHQRESNCSRSPEPSCGVHVTIRSNFLETKNERERHRLGVRKLCVALVMSNNQHIPEHI